MKIKPNILTCLILNGFVLLQVNAYPFNQDNINSFSIGFYGNFNINFLNAVFKLPVPTVPGRVATFGSPVNNFDFSFGMTGNIPLSRMFSLSTKIGYNGMNGILNNFGEADWPVMHGDTVFSDTLIHHKFQAKLSYFEISPVIQFNDFDKLKKLYLLLGFDLGIPIESKYSQSESIIVPSKYPEGGTSRIYAVDKNIPDLNLLFGIIAGGGYKLKLSDNINLLAELTISFPLNNISKNINFQSWSETQVRLGLIFLYSI